MPERGQPVVASRLVDRSGTLGGSSRRGLAANVALLTASCVFGLLCLEGVARVYYSRLGGGRERNERARYTEHDPFLGWRKTPGARVNYERREYRTEVAVNALGERDAERSLRKPTGTFRILALGDSFVEGYSVALEDGLTRRLERRLSAPSCRIEVLNTGTSGWSTDQEYLYFVRRGIDYQPDVVVIFVYYNDIVQNTWRVYWGAPKPLLGVEDGRVVVLHSPISPPPPRPAPPVAAPSRFEGSAALHWTRERLLYGAPRLYDGVARLGLWAPVGGDAPDGTFRVYKARRRIAFIEEAWSLTDAILRELSSEVGRAGARFAIAYVPSQMEVDDRSWELTRLRFGLNETWDRGFVAKRVREIADSAGIPVIDLTPDLRDASRGLLNGVYFPIDGHWNERGHATVARALETFFRESGWLPACAR